MEAAATPTPTPTPTPTATSSVKSRPLWFILLRVVIPLWCIVVPIGLVVFVVTLPLRLLAFFRGQTPKPSNGQIGVRDVAGTGKSKGDILFIHGWPDSGSLWDAQVAHFSKLGYRCLVVTMPQFDGVEYGGWGFTFDQLTQKLAALVQDKCGGQKVTLFLHDWGCTWGYMLARLHPELVARVIALDVGGDVRPDLPMRVMIMAYQWFLILAFLLGGQAGNIMNRLFLRASNYAARPMAEINSSMNYPYLHLWRSLLSGRRDGPLAPFKPDLDACPVFFGYGKFKPGMFHSDVWLQRLSSNSKCRVQEFKSDHWVQVGRAQEVNESVAAWLAQFNGSS